MLHFKYRKQRHLVHECIQRRVQDPCNGTAHPPSVLCDNTSFNVVLVDDRPSA